MYRARGVYYVTTNPDAPFARGFPGKTNRAQDNNYGGLKQNRISHQLPVKARESLQHNNQAQHLENDKKKQFVCTVNKNN